MDEPLLAAALCCLAFSLTAFGDVEVAKKWAGSTPTVDGTVSPGEWTSATATTLAHGQMRTMNVQAMRDPFHWKGRFVPNFNPEQTVGPHHQGSTSAL